MMLKVARPEASCLELSLQHGYMRCYAPAFSRNKTFMRELEKLAEKLPKWQRRMTYLYVRLSSGAHVALYAQFLTTRWDGSIITDLCFATGSKVDWTDGLAAYSKTKGP